MIPNYSLVYQISYEHACVIQDSADDNKYSCFFQTSVWRRRGDILGFFLNLNNNNNNNFWDCGV